MSTRWVRYHGTQRGQQVRRISDLIATPTFRNSLLYDEYCRRIGIDHALAVPLHSDDGWLVSFVLNRSGRDFSDREVALLDQVRRVLARLFDRGHLLERTRQACGAAAAEPLSLSAFAAADLARTRGLALGRRRQDRSLHRRHPGEDRHACTRTFARDGTWLIVEPFANDRLEDNLNPVGRIFYSPSTFICTPNSRFSGGRCVSGGAAG